MTRHYVAGVPDAVHGKWEPQEACGFTLADVSSMTRLNNMPEGVDGIVYVRALNGVDQTFRDFINRWRTNPKVWGYYLVDEPVPNISVSSSHPVVTPQTFKQQTDYIKQHHPGAKTYVKCTNEGSVRAPRWSYTPANTGLDFIGIGGYAVRAAFPGHYDPELIERYVSTAVRDGIPLEVISPVYQCFGGAANWPTPTREQMDGMFASWRQCVPNPVWDFAYRWFIQSIYGTSDLSNSQMMRDAINRHFAAMEHVPPTDESLGIRVSGGRDTLRIKSGDTLRVESSSVSDSLNLRLSGSSDAFPIKRGDTLRVE